MKIENIKTMDDLLDYINKNCLPFEEKCARCDPEIKQLCSPCFTPGDPDPFDLLLVKIITYNRKKKLEKLLK